MGWSKIQHTDLAMFAREKMDDNHKNGCMYHNNDHVDAMYGYVESTGMQYDEALDWAILFHDCVYDSLPHKELRSVDAFINAVDMFEYPISNQVKEDVQTMILATIDHRSSPSVDAIIRADLHALTDPKMTLLNFHRIKQESCILYGCTTEEFFENSRKFMTSLKSTIQQNQKTDQSGFYNKVEQGIDQTILLATNKG